MNNLTLKIKRGKRPGYLKISDSIRTAITSGQLNRGDSLPSTRRLAEELGFHRHTVMNALDQLISEGWIKSIERKGYFVSSELPDSYLLASTPPKTKEAKNEFVWPEPDLVSKENIDELDLSQIKYSFQSGQPDLREFPYSDFRHYIKASLEKDGPRVLSYHYKEGHPKFLAELRKFLRRARNLHDDKEIIITHGSQQSIYITAQLCLKPGDHVAVERLAYPPAINALRSAGANIVAIDIDNEGLIPESLERQCKSRKIKLLYITPLHQYPTTATLPVERRLRLLELAQKYGFGILEDDYDHEFHYRAQPLPPLAASDTSGQVIYVSTFSKLLFPAARLGFAVVPKSLAKNFASYQKMTTSMHNTLIQDVVARWMRSGDFDRYLRRIRRLYEERRDYMHNYLSELSETNDFDWQLPDGGMAIWLNLNKNSSKISNAGITKHVFAHPEADFRLDGKTGNHIRLGFAACRPHEIKRGLDLLLNI